MDTKEMRKKIREFSETGDDRIIRIMNAIIDSEQENRIELSEEHQQVLDERLAYHRKHPKESTEWEDFKSELEDKYGL